MNHIILIQMLFEIFILSDCIILKHCFGIASPAVIRCQHISRNGFSKSAWTAVADHGAVRIHCSVGIFQQFCFIYINI